MQFGLCAVLVLILMDIADSNRVVKGRRHKRRSTEMSLVCSKGCELCSEFNGCIKCSPKFFFLLERNDIRQLGVCLLSCPVGYFDVRNREINKCMKCKINNCETCFSKDFCTKCNEGFYKHKRSCYSTCPDGTVADNSTMECSPAQCEMSEWGAWSPCSRKKKCGKKRGNEERSRKVLHAPLGDISVCPLTTERRICIMPKVQCPKGEKKKKGAGNKQKNKNRDKNIEDPGNKKKKGQLRVTSMPITPSIPAQ
ncbi:R-spondin-1 isoform 2-T2 [Discoglossus pictus]